jgi:hypothetical protein
MMELSTHTSAPFACAKSEMLRMSGDLQPRVGGRLEHHHGGRPAVDRALHRVEVVHIDVHHLDAHFRHNLRQKTARAAVDVVARNDALARSHQARDAHQSRHAAGKRKRAIRVLQLRHLLL